ncbi:hypothetical protein DQ04_03641060 [Trypanosoma grayi]|uniref:hypothetical protein n=1 Tax=Trypanosoma grayi TaxID=71804 RepID=UPI0004F47B15|nr:hypothetical protein DQ04_03641060 [Trypanosoma grayi]KEG10499.1 hypothetical protein DQ04_03641060 [Trypanosoma grayi]
MNLLTPFALLIVNWSLDFTDPEVQRIISYIFYLVHGVVFIVMGILFFRIWVSDDTRVVHAKDSYTNEMEKMTTWEYDSSRWRTLFFSKLLLPVAVGLFVASRWNTPFPLLLQCISNPNTVYRFPLFQLHLLHKPEEGKLVRPWKEESVMPEWMQQIWQQSQPSEETPAPGSPAHKNKKRKSYN